jgi:hypothetical protein
MGQSGVFTGTLANIEGVIAADMRERWRTLKLSSPHMRRDGFDAPSLDRG